MIEIGEHAELFVVIRRGIHDQRVVGTFLDEMEAITAAEQAKNDEPDDYHHFVILKRNLGVRHSLEKLFGVPDEPILHMIGTP